MLWSAGPKKKSNIYISIRDRRDFLFLAKGYDYRVMENDSKKISPIKKFGASGLMENVFCKYIYYHFPLLYSHYLWPNIKKKRWSRIQIYIVDTFPWPATTAMRPASLLIMPNIVSNLVVFMETYPVAFAIHPRGTMDSPSS